MLGRTGQSGGPALALLTRQIGAMALALIPMSSKNQLKLIVQWIGAVVVFFCCITFMAGFMNIVITNAIKDSLLYQGIYFNGKYTTFLIFLTVGEFVLVGFAIKFLLKLFPWPSRSAMVIMVIAALFVLGNIGNQKAFDTPAHLATWLFYLALLTGTALCIRQAKTNKQQSI